MLYLLWKILCITHLLTEGFLKKQRNPLVTNMPQKSWNRVAHVRTREAFAWAISLCIS